MKPEGQKQLGRPFLRLEGNIKLDHKVMDGKVGTGFVWHRIEERCFWRR